MGRRTSHTRAVRALTERYLEARFGERPLDATERSEVDRALGDLARALTMRTRG